MRVRAIPLDPTNRSSADSMQKAIGTLGVCLSELCIKKAIDGVVLDASRREDAGDAPLLHGHARLFESSLRRGMRFGEPADPLRLVIGSRPALFEIGKVLEEVSKQIRVARSGLTPGRGHNVRRALGNANFERSMSVTSGARPGVAALYRRRMPPWTSLQRNGLSVTIQAPVAWAKYIVISKFGASLNIFICPPPFPPSNEPS